MVEEREVTPWSVRPRFAGRSLARVGAGALVASFFIGTADITISTRMGALFGFDMWWTFVVLGVAGWALMDMSVRYFLRFGRSPLSLFKELHPLLCGYLFLTVVVTTIVGAYSQWNACAQVLSDFHPALPTEVGGALAALAAVALLAVGAYRRLEHLFVAGLLALVVLFAAAAIAADAPWGDAWRGLVPGGPVEPRERWKALLQANAGSLINAWLILVYPYTMVEKGWYSRHLGEQLRILQRARWDYGVGMAAAAVVALPIMAVAAAVARPFGIFPSNSTEFAALLEPVAGSTARTLFLAGLFLAAWTAGIGWIVCGTYAMLDLGNIRLKMDSRPFRVCLAIFGVASASILFLRVNPFDGIQVFAAFLAVVFPVVALAMVWRLSRPDMGYYRWWPRNVRGLTVVLLDLFALAVSLYVGWGMMSSFLAS
ncbi:MAG: divalent metal cation transporter [Planctomycetota bacterium]|nr:divalent metal cation transporter [Planctomycetota bacterium]